MSQFTSSISFGSNMDLFDLPPYQKTRPTSLAGAIDAKDRAKTQATRIYQHIKMCGEYGATACELKPVTEIQESSTMSARLNSLMKDGKIIASEDKRKSKYDILQIVWKAV